jgi:hypothetical protein
MHPINDKRPCDACIFMTDTFHLDMCLHPARRAPGALGDALNEALHWNGDCPMQQAGRPAFYALLDLDLPIEEWEAAGEYLRAWIAEHLHQHGSITAEDIVHYAARYEQARAVVG